MGRRWRGKCGALGSRGRSRGRFKERVGYLGVRALDGEFAGVLGVMGEPETRRGEGAD